jgi:hypothetical protein
MAMSEKSKARRIAMSEKLKAHRKAERIIYKQTEALKKLQRDLTAIEEAIEDIGTLDEMKEVGKDLHPKGFSYNAEHFQIELKNTIKKCQDLIDKLSRKIPAP